MSLEYYTCNGIILPIGLAVCGICRDKHLRSVDLSNSRIIPPNSPEIIIPDSNSNSSTITNIPTKREPTSPTSELMMTSSCPPKMRQLSTSSSKVTSTNGDVQIVAMSPPPDRVKGEKNFVKSYFVSHTFSRKNLIFQMLSRLLYLFPHPREMLVLIFFQRLLI